MMLRFQTGTTYHSLQETRDRRKRPRNVPCKRPLPLRDPFDFREGPCTDPFCDPSLRPIRAVGPLARAFRQRARFKPRGFLIAPRTTSRRGHSESFWNRFARILDEGPKKTLSNGATSLSKDPCTAVCKGSLAACLGPGIGSVLVEAVSRPEARLLGRFSHLPPQYSLARILARSLPPARPLVALEGPLCRNALLKSCRTAPRAQVFRETPCKGPGRGWFGSEVISLKESWQGKAAEAPAVFLKLLQEAQVDCGCLPG
jgi:hypothetical protein